MANVQEFGPGCEIVTASLTSPLVTGESYGTPISIGYYPEVQDEIWIEAEGARINIQTCDIPAFVRQLKRAAMLAKEQPK
jgi:hypothetical protein